ncbi:MAG: helix-turn-helix domain-containing protein [Mycobacterium sp.]
MTADVAESPPESARPSQKVSRVLGNELRAVRKQRGWTRRDLLSHSDLDISLQTLATYELGTRHCTVVRLWELSEVLDEPMDQLIVRVMRGLGEWEASGLTIDLRAAAANTLANLGPLSGWAKAQLATRPPDHAPAVSLNRAALDRLAQVCGLDTAELMNRLQDQRAGLVIARPRAEDSDL